MKNIGRQHFGDIRRIALKSQRHVERFEAGTAVRIVRREVMSQTGPGRCPALGHECSNLQTCHTAVSSSGWPSAS